MSFGQACGRMEPALKGPASSPASTRSPTDGGTSTIGAGSTLANAYGYIDPVSSLGTVTGEVKDPANPTVSQTVFFFVNGPQGQGLSAGSIVANQPSLGNSGGNTRFLYVLPAEFRNGSVQTLYAYALIGGTYQQIGGSPHTYAAYTPRPEGKAYYEANLLPTFQQRCVACHAVSYSGHYSNLLSPTRFKGGTATNNDLINYISGTNRHGGGNFCGAGKSSGLCLTVQNWWNLEFP